MEGKFSVCESAKVSAAAVNAVSSGLGPSHFVYIIKVFVVLFVVVVFKYKIYLHNCNGTVQ